MKDLHEVLRLSRRLIGLDLETTGKNSATARIVEIGLVIMTPHADGVSVKESRTYVNPGIPIPADATAVHHITDDMVSSARPFSAYAENLLKGFAGADFAGYRVMYDLQVLAAEFQRCKHVWDWEGSRIVDASRLWQMAETRTLTDAVKKWLPEIEDEFEAHSALSDAKLSTLVAAAILQAKASLPRDIDQLHEAQFPDRYDLDGRLRWNEKGDLVIGFGKHKDIPLWDVPRSYLEWVIREKFSEKVKTACQLALAGKAPKRESCI